MAQSGKAPRILGWVNKRGVPVWAILLTNAVGAISMMNVSTGAARAYGYIVNLSGVSTFLVWGSISFIHIRFRRGWAARGRTAEELPYKSMLYPWIAYFGLSANIILALIQGWTHLSPFNAGNFVDAYILLPLFGLIYVVCKLIWWKTDKFQRSWTMDLDSGRRIDLDQKGYEVNEEGQMVRRKKAPLWKRIWDSA
jgi:yeast amino acid transporter